MGTVNTEPGYLVRLENDEEFRIGLASIDMEGVIELIRRLQQEMADEQEDFNALKEELGECDELDERRRQEITELMVESQDRLSSLMDKMGQCFESQEQRKAKQVESFEREVNHSGSISPESTPSPREGSPTPNERLPPPSERIPTPPRERSPSPVREQTRSAFRGRSPSPIQRRSPSPTLPQQSKSHQIYSTVQHSQNNGTTSQRNPEPEVVRSVSTEKHLHQNNLEKLNKLVSSHKSGSSIPPTQSQPKGILKSTANRSAVVNQNGTDTTKSAFNNEVNIKVGESKPKTVKITQPTHELKPEHGQSYINQTNGSSTGTTKSILKSVTETRTDKQVVTHTVYSPVPNIRVEQPKPKPSDSEPVKLRQGPKAPKPIKRLSVSEARNLFESSSPASDNTSIQRRWSRGSIDLNPEEKDRLVPPWVKEEQERAASLGDISRVDGGSDPDMPSEPMKKSSTPVMAPIIGGNHNKPTGNKAASKGFNPVVRKAWDSQTISTTTPTKTAAPPAAKKASHSTPSVKVAVSTNIIPQQPVPVNKTKAKPVQNSLPINATTTSVHHTNSNTKPATKVSLRANQSNNLPAVLPNKDLLRDITNARQVKQTGSHSSHVGEEEETAKLAVKLKPVSERVQKSEPLPRKANVGKPAPVKSPVELKAPDDRVPLAMTSPMTQDSEGFTADDAVQDRVTLKQWDPTILLNELYEVKLNPDSSEGEMTYVNLEGYMEKLPLNKKKATLLKNWKKRYFKAFNGNLYYYESSKKPKKGPEDLEKATGCLPLGGGSLEHMGERMMGIDDGRGRYLVVRALNDKDYKKWTEALNSQIATDVKVKWVRPLPSANPHPNKKVVIIDIGSCSVRAGILGEAPALPHLFFPTIVAIDKATNKESVGFEVAKPSVRATSEIIFPVRPSVKVDKFSLNLAVMPALFRHVFNKLKINSKDYWVMFSAPANLTDKVKEEFMNILINTFHVLGVNIVNQTLLALYSYNSMSGIVVDIGERLEIVPVTDGYIVEQGVCRQPYGGHAITQALNNTFTEKRYRFFSHVEFQIVRLAMERMCMVVDDYDKSLKDCNKNPDKYRKSIDMAKYELPKGSWTHVTNDIGRFKSTEGMFNLEVWGMDNPPLHKLIQNAVQASPMDTRREMWRSIYLSGGVTMLPGFVERLEKEVLKLAPNSVPVEIHASPQRYHAAYIGACALAGMSVFERSCISAEEWTKMGPSVLRKWHMY